MTDNAYMKIEGIEGAAFATGYERWIVLTTIQWAVYRQTTTSFDSRLSGMPPNYNPSCSEITVTKKIDTSSPMIFTEACCGKPKLIQIDLCDTSSSVPRAYMRYELDDCSVIGYSFNLDGVITNESISLSFGKIRMKYISYDNDGNEKSTIQAGHDFSKGK